MGFGWVDDLHGEAGLISMLFRLFLPCIGYLENVLQRPAKLILQCPLPYFGAMVFYCLWALALSKRSN